MKSKKDPRLKRAGVSGFNKPKRTPNHPTKSHVVVAKEGNTTKTIRFGQQGVSGDKLILQEQNHLKQGTPKILAKARCRRRTGRTKLSGSKKNKL